MASKVQERIFVENFLPHLGSDYVIVDERESPNFIISRGTERFGLEVAQVFRDQSPTGSPTKAAESRRVQYLKRLASKYYSSGGLPLLVKLSRLPEGEIDTVADRLKVERPSSSGQDSRFELGRSILYLKALPAEFGWYSRWICINNSVGWSGLLTDDDIKSLISEKASKLPRYHEAIDRVNFLLVVDRTSTSGMVRWQKGAQFPARQGFDAIYLYFYPGESMIAEERIFTF